jgi:peptidoglycan/LPS O-acetylase OafA/YrhL
MSILIMVGIARYVIWSYKVEDLAYSSLYTFTRIDGLCIGSMVALLQKINPGFLKKNTVFIVLLMAAINFGFYFINNRQGFTLPYLAFVGYTTFAVLFGILLYEAVTGESTIIRFLLDNRPLKFFGRISYGLYVYHWPVYILLFDHTRNWIIGRNIISYRFAEICTGVFVSIVAVLISVLSYRYFEKPFLKLKAKYS